MNWYGQRAGTGQAVIDRCIGNASLQPPANAVGVLPLVARHPAATVNVHQQRARSVAIRFPEIQHLLRMRPVRRVGLRGASG